MDWPKWSEGKRLINFGANSNSYLNDDFRADTFTFLKNNVASLRV
jgi:hypothetical protein